MWYSMTHSSSCGQRNWKCLTLHDITSSPTLTQGSRMGERVKHPCYNHIWVPSQGDQWRNQPLVSPPPWFRTISGMTGHP